MSYTPVAPVCDRLLAGVVAADPARVSRTPWTGADRCGVHEARTLDLLVASMEVSAAVDA